MSLRYLLLCLLFPVLTIKSQLSGSYTVPGSFSSVAVAVQSLNLYGVSGPVTVNIATGYTETVPFGGIVLQPAAGGSSVNTITFKSSGTGQAPQLLAYSGGTATAASARQDGIWAITGSDYVTIEGLELRDMNNSAGTTMEYGIGLFKNTVYDGCQHVSIRNCTISLNSAFVVASSLTPAAGARGINVVNATLYNQNVPLAILSAGGSNSYNEFTGNVIENVHNGIVLMGYEDVAPFALNDRNNKVGNGTAPGANRILNFGHATASVEVNAIVAKAQYDLSVCSNEISNLSATSVPTVPVRAIMALSGSGALLQIKSNTLIVRGNSATGTISIVETSGAATIDTVDITNNRFNNCSFLQNNSSPFFGIRQRANTGYLRIQDNAFSNVTLGSVGGFIYLIASQGNVTSEAVIASNTLALTFQRTSAFTGTLQCISHSGGSENAKVMLVDNRFSAFYHSTTGNGEYNFIHNSSPFSSSVTINNNSFVGLSINSSGNIYLVRNTGVVNNYLSASSNSVVSGFSRILGFTGNIYCIYLDGRSPGSCIQDVMNNRFSSFTINSGDGGFNGIVNFEGLVNPFPQKNVSNNIVSDIYFPNSTFLSRLLEIKNTGDGILNQGSSVYSNTVSNVTLNGPFKGIAVTNSVASGMPLEVYSNVVHNLYAGFNSQITGMFVQGPNTEVRIYRNKITSVTTAGPYSEATGLNVYGYSTTVYNNIIGHINAAGSLGTPVYSAFVNGMLLMGTNTLRVLHNTVYLTGNNHSSNAAYVYDWGTTELTNNIFVNLSTGNVVRAMRRGGPTISNISRKTNNNLYYAGTPGSANIIYTDGVNTFSTLAGYQAMGQGLEPNSVTENPPFASTTPASASYLTLLTNTATRIESGAIYLPEVPVDFTNAARSFSTTDIGAFEGNLTTYTPNVLPPVIGDYSLTGSPCGVGSKTIQINILDPTSIATGSLAPTVYYRLNTGTYTPVSGSLLSGNALNGTWAFTPTYSAVSGDVVSWFVVSQDQSGNAVVWPAAGATVVSVNSVVATPTNPVTYTAGMSLSGIYNVGAGGTFSTLTQAANAYNIACLTGPVTFSLTDTLYSANETFPITFGENPTANSTNSLLVMPANGSRATISGTVAYFQSLVKFYKASHITVDGTGGANTGISVIIPGPANTGAAIWLASDNAEKKGNSNVSFRNLYVKGAGGNNGIVTGDQYGTGQPAYNSSISVISNTMLNVGYGVGSFGFGSQSASSNNHWKIENNLIGFPVSGSLIINNAGIYAINSRSISILSNTIQNVSSSDETGAGISLLNVCSFTVDNNRISDVRQYNYINYGGPEHASGLYVGTGSSDGVISNNQILNLKDVSNQGMVIGINVLTRSQNSSLKIFNNFIGDFKAGGGSSVDLYVRAISIEGGSSGIDVDHNTIYLAGAYFSEPNPTGTSCIFVDNLPSVPDGPGNVRLRNNIIYNTQNNTSTATDRTYCIYSKLPVSFFTEISNNSFYSGGTQFRYGYFGSDLISYNSFTAALPNGHNSINALPVTQSSVDLHLDPSALANYAIDGKASPLPHVTLDIDGGIRSSVAPDIGADEFVSTATCQAAYVPTLVATSITVCQSQNVSLIANTQPGGIGTTYQWKMSTFSGGSYSAITTGTGLSTNSATAVIGSPGIYYAVLESACNTTMTALSGEFTVVVNAPPAPTIVPGTTLTCAGGSVSFTATGANSYTWSNGSTGSVMTVPNNALGSYFVLGATQGCSPVYSNSVNILYASFPFSAQSSSSTICKGDTVVLSASGAMNYTWSTGGTAASVAVTPSVTQVYTVQAHHTGGCVNSNTIGITVMQVPTVSIAGDATVCAGLPLNLTAQGATGYFWINNAATTVSTQVTPTATTVYSVVGTGANGCSSVGQKTVVVTNTLSVNILGSNTVCANAPVSHSVTGNYQYVWTTPSGTVSGQSIITSPLSDFVYQVTASTLACTGGASLFVSAFSPTVSVSGQFTACLGSPATLTAAGAQNYTWQPVGLTGSIVSYTSGAMPAFTVSGVDIHGCSADFTFATTSLSLPVISVVASSPSVCAGLITTFTASGADSYTWSNGGGTGSSASYTPSSSQVYTVIGSELSTGCSAGASFSILVHPNPSITVSGNSAVCNGQSATLVAGGASSYTWNGSIASSSLAVSPSATSNYSLLAQDANGCQSQTVVSVIVHALPILNITPASLTVCAMTTSTLSVSGAVSYTWGTGAAGSSILFSGSTNTVYTVAGTSSAGCVNSQSVSILVNPLPSVAILPASASVCLLSPVTFTAQGANSYSWSDNGGSLSTTTYTPGGNHIYTVTGTDNNGCVNTRTVGITTYSLPVLVVSGDTSLCTGDATTLLATGAQSFTWSTGAFTSSVSVFPSANTIYTITGMDQLGCSSKSTVTVYVHSMPSISISLSSPTLCAGETVTATASGANTYSWSGFGTSASITTTLNASSDFTVHGLSGFGCPGTQTAAVVVHTLPVMSVVPPSQTLCAGNAVSFTAYGAPNVIWTGITSSAPSVTFTPSGSGTIGVTGSDPLTGCNGSSTASIVVNALPLVSVAGNSAVCSGGSVQLTASGASSYSWSNGATGLSTVLTPPASTVISVTGTAQNSCSSVANFTIVVAALPTVAASGNQVICAGETAVLVATGANSYSWSTGSTVQTITVTPVTSNTYVVWGYLGQLSCSDSLSVSVQVNALPVVAATISKDTVCAGESIVLLGSGASLYQWSGGVSNGVSFTPQSSNSYTVTGTDANGCKDEYIVSNVVLYGPSVTISGSDTLCSGDQLTLVASGALSYTWNTGHTGDTLTEIPAAGPSVYLVTATGTNNCTSITPFALHVDPCTGIKGNEEDLIFVYPTVCIDRFYIRGYQTTAVYAIYDLAGKLVAEGKITLPLQEIYIGTVARGLYILRHGETGKLPMEAKIVVQQ